MGLNKSYEHAHIQILMMTPAPPVNKAYFMLMERESQRSMTNTFVSMEWKEGTTLMTIRTWYQAGNQQPAYQTGYQQTGYRQKGKKNFNFVCDFCKLRGHTRDGCYKIIGYPSDLKVKKKTDNNMAHNATLEEKKSQECGEGSFQAGADKHNITRGIAGLFLLENSTTKF